MRGLCEADYVHDSRLIINFLFVMKNATGGSRLQIPVYDADSGSFFSSYSRRNTSCGLPRHGEAPLRG